MNHSHYELMAHNSTYYEHAVDEDFPLNFEEICAVTAEENMKALQADNIYSHPIGMAMVGTYWTPHQVQHTDVVSYAGLTNFTSQQGKKLAVIGGIITLPEQRNKGFADETVKGLIKAASTPEAVTEYGHEGFIARCNTSSKPLMEKLGFSMAGEEMGKIVMVKLF